MCGIAGYISKDNDKNLKPKVEKMLSTIVHRGPDGSGTYFYNDHVGLGHRRLSIIDLTDNGKQPMNYQGRYHITFNGEIYNYIELRRKLESYGMVFNTETDTEVLLASYCRWGKDCVSHLNGMWAFAIFDEAAGELFASRDRFGVKPFYYYIDGEKFVFGSEIKELLEVMPKPIKADRDHLSAYLVSGSFDYDEGTMFDGVKQLVGGYNLVLDCDNLTYSIERYYDLRKIKQNNNTREENEGLFRERFEQSVRFRLRSDVPVGSCLSGGLDSSAIVCMVHEVLNQDNDSSSCQATVSSCFEDKKYDEQEYIDEVAKKTGVESYKVFPDMDRLFEKLDQIIWHMDEPFAGTSIYAQWCVFEEAKRQGLTVMLDGQGSDEQLAGYTPFYKVLFIELMKKTKWKQLKKEVDAYRLLRSDSEPVGFSEVMMSTISSFLLPDFLRSFFNKIYLKKVTGLPFPKEMYHSRATQKIYRAYNKRDAGQYIYASMHYGLRTLLHYEDRDSMAHSIESRVPFLDYELVEFVYSVPLEHKIVNGRTKNLIREGLKNVLPDQIYNRISKLGFVTPEDKWIKENEDFIYRELDQACDRLNGLLDKNQVVKWYGSHVKSMRRGDSTCFRIICAAHWADVFDVSII